MALTPRRLRGMEHDQDRMRSVFLAAAIARGLNRGATMHRIADGMTRDWRMKRAGAAHRARDYLLTFHRLRGGRVTTPAPPGGGGGGSGEWGVGLPEGYMPLPIAQRVDVTPHLWPGTTYFIPSGDTTALFNAYASYDPSEGDRIILEASGVWTFAANTGIGAKVFADGQMALMQPENWDDIAAALPLAADGMPAGMPREYGDPWTGANTRMTEAQAVALGIPIIECTGLGSSLAFFQDSGGLYIRGIWFRNMNTSGQCSGCVNISHYAPSAGYSSIDQMARDVVLSQCVVGREAADNMQKAIRFCGDRLAFVNGTAWGFSKYFSDANAWWGASGRGPWKVTNNMIAGSGENAFIGGNVLEEYHRPFIPSDIEMNYNWYHRPTYRLEGHPDFIPVVGGFNRFITKNPWETKFGKRIEVIGCVADGCVSTPGGQGGQSFSPKTSSQGGATFDFVQCSDLLIALTKSINVGSGFILYYDQAVGGAEATEGTVRMLLEDNLVIMGDPAAFAGGRRPFDLTGTEEGDQLYWALRRNTFVGFELHNHYRFLSPHDGSTLLIENNVHQATGGTSTQPWAVVGDSGELEGDGTVANNSVGLTMRGVTFTGRAAVKASRYAVYGEAAGNHFPLDNTDLGLNPDGTLPIGSPLRAGGAYEGFGGIDNGANVALIEAATSGVMTAEL